MFLTTLTTEKINKTVVELNISKDLPKPTLKAFTRDFDRKKKASSFGCALDILIIAPVFSNVLSDVFLNIYVCRILNYKDKSLSFDYDGTPEYAIPKIKMLCNLRCLKARLRLLYNNYQRHSSLNLVLTQLKLSNIVIFGMT